MVDDLPEQTVTTFKLHLAHVWAVLRYAVLMKLDTYKHEMVRICTSAATKRRLLYSPIFHRMTYRKGAIWHVSCYRFLH